MLYLISKVIEANPGVINSMTYQEYGSDKNLSAPSEVPVFGSVVIESEGQSCYYSINYINAELIYLHTSNVVLCFESSNTLCRRTI